MALSENQLAAIEILVANPTATFESIAKTVGVTDRTVYNWRQLPEFNAELAKRGSELVDSTMYQKAVQDKDSRAAQLWYQRFGLLGADEAADPLAKYFDLKPEEKKAVMVAVAEWYLVNNGSSKIKGKKSAAVSE